MVPLCSRGKISHEVDSIIWYFQPRVGSLDYDTAEIFQRIVDAPVIEQMKLTQEYVNKILVGWEGKTMPSFPTDGNPAQFFSHEERVELLILWKKANALTVEEKKS